MSYKSTRYVTRAQAMAALFAVIPQASDRLLGNMLDVIADEIDAHDATFIETLSISFRDNFIVTDEKDADGT